MWCTRTFKNARKGVSAAAPGKSALGVHVLERKAKHNPMSTFPTQVHTVDNKTNKTWEGVAADSAFIKKYYALTQADHAMYSYGDLSFGILITRNKHTRKM